MDQAPEVSQSLRQRMQVDSQNLGQAAERLLAVQSDINRVEKEVQGRVFDLETVHNFFATHEGLQAENSELKQRQKEVNNQLAELGNQLYNAQKNYNVDNAKFRSEIEKKDGTIAEQSVLIAQLKQEVDKLFYMKEENQKIKEVNTALT